VEEASTPKHVGIILDGNRRWAKKTGVDTLKGHQRGSEVFKKISLHMFDRGVNFVSGYIFSTENWQRKAEEVDYLMRLVIKAVEMHLDEYHKKGIKIKILGSREKLSSAVLKAVERTESKTADNTNGTLALCFNYGGKQEIIDAANKIIQNGGTVSEDSITENLYAPEVPDVDFLVRTSGEQRLSGFMLWRAQYAELYFEQKFWPEVTVNDADAWLEEYNNRQRRFGG
jgi:undecaprenyl diphosphate synthase